MGLNLLKPYLEWRQGGGGGAGGSSPGPGLPRWEGGFFTIQDFHTDRGAAGDRLVTNLSNVLNFVHLSQHKLLFIQMKAGVKLTYTRVRGSPNPSQGGQFYRITPLEEGVAQACGPTICAAPLYAVPLPP